MWLSRLLVRAALPGSDAGGEGGRELQILHPVWTVGLADKGSLMGKSGA